MTIGPHTHPCVKCWKDVECCGDIKQQKYAGPNVFRCVEFISHHPDWLCDECEAKEVIRAK